MNWLRDKEYTEEEFLWSKERTAHPVPLIRAVNYLVTQRFSRGGMGKTFAWSDRLRGNQPGDVNAWHTIRDEFPSIAARVANVDFCCLSATTLIAAHDSSETLTYCDLPYIPESRTARKVYDHEMTRGDHAELLAILLACCGKVAISGYNDVMYDGMLKKWNRVDFEMANHSGQGKTKQRRIECLWMNYDPPTG